jgi:hypothetical protein
MSFFYTLTPEMGWGDVVPEGWSRPTAVRLLILVGLTGVGKSSTVQALQEAGLDFELLPNRRAMADELVIGTIQTQWGEPRHPIHDRTERFAYTRRYRELYPAGIAHALSQLAINLPAMGNPAWWLFDGLRGEDEVRGAVELFPQAHFLLLEADDQTRVERLLQRGEAFDYVAGESGVGAEVAGFRLGELGDFLPATAVATLENLVHTGQVTPQELLAKVKIVRTERENYEVDTAVSALQTIAPDRTHQIDSTQHTPSQIAAWLIKRLT